MVNPLDGIDKIKKRICKGCITAAMCPKITKRQMRGGDFEGIMELHSSIAVDSNGCEIFDSEYYCNKETN